MKDNIQDNNAKNYKTNIYLYLFVKLDDIIVFFQYDNLIEINKIVSV